MRIIWIISYEYLMKRYVHLDISLLWGQLLPFLLALHRCRRSSIGLESLRLCLRTGGREERLKRLKRKDFLSKLERKVKRIKEKNTRINEKVIRVKKFNEYKKIGKRKVRSENVRFASLPMTGKLECCRHGAECHRFVSLFSKVYLYYKYKRNRTYHKARCMMVLHNMGYQGSSTHARSWMRLRQVPFEPFPLGQAESLVLLDPFGSFWNLCEVFWPSKWSSSRPPRGRSEFWRGLHQPVGCGRQAGRPCSVRGPQQNSVHLFLKFFIQKIRNIFKI